jgi:ethanolamine ammonia-lyase small subunit
MAHAMARDAVHIPLNLTQLLDAMHQRGWQTASVNSRVKDRHSYLLRPDLGRRLSEESSEYCRKNKPDSPVDFLIVVGDGLSSAAITNHAVAVIEKIKSHFPLQWKMGPIVCAAQARVAIADEIASIWQVPMVAILIGERPGLSSPDSLGIYFTFNPSLQSTDADRNCISNIRPQGLSYELAAKKLIWLAQQAAQLKYSGVRLKDESDIPVLDASKK